MDIMRTLRRAALALVALSAPLLAQDAPATPAPPGWLEGLTWRQVGPYRGGRSAACTGVPGQPDTFWFGASGGGVWKSLDAGASWENVSDGTFGGSIGAVAVSSWDPNVVYVGGGEETVRGNVSEGDGVWRSDDAGKTWRHLGLADTRHVCRIRIHPRDPDTAWVAALGHLFGPNDERGVFRTTDGGKTWKRVLFVSDAAGCVDLALDPTNPRVLYACFWRVLRTPWSLESGGEGSGIWKSTDGGDTWTELTHDPGLPEGPLGISGISVSRTDPDNVYAIVEAAKGGVFRSRDGGKTWSRTSEDHALRQRAWYYSRIYADPADEESVYVVNVRFQHSVDGGKTFAAIGTPHGDNHDLWIDPGDPARMIEANDGGVNVTTDGGKTWSTQANQPTAQIYRLSADDDFPYRLLGAQQDNSALRIRSRSLRGGSIGRGDWEPTAGGESGDIVARPGEPDVVYGGSYSGYLERLDHRTGIARRVDVAPDDPIGGGADAARERFQWNFPLFFSPHDPDVLYAASNHLFRSHDGGASWERISPDLTRNDPAKLGSSGGPITKDNTGVEIYCTIFAAFESPADADVLWCGSDDGLVHLTRDGGKSWADVTPPALPEWSQVNSMVPDPFHREGAYLAATRYRLDDSTPYLFHTTDWGATWTRIDAGIPRDAFTRAVCPDPGRQGLLYAGTEHGVFVSFDDGAGWRSLQLDLPIVPVTDMLVHDGDLAVATQGRGFWILDDVGPLREMQDVDGATSQLQLIAPRPTVRVSAHRAKNPGSAGTNPLPGVLFTYVLPAVPPADAAFSLAILAQDGTVIRTFTREPAEGSKPEPLPKYLVDDDRVLPAKAGWNRFSWDLRYPSAETFEGAILWHGNLTGPLALSGSYRARLTVGEETREVGFEVVPDPRATATEEDLHAQFELHHELVDTITSIHQGIRHLRAARKGIDALKERAGDSAPDVAQAATELLDDLKAVEERLYQTKSESPQDPLNYPIRLDDKLAGVMGVVATGPWAPTAQARAVYEDLAGQAHEALTRLSELLGARLEALNAAARAANVPAVGTP